MTIKTLTYIHNLLKEDVAQREDVKKYIREVYDTALEATDPTAEHLREQYNDAKDKYYDALHALEDFEAKEW